jgi:hypothetical protein
MRDGIVATIQTRFAGVGFDSNRSGFGIRGYFVLGEGREMGCLLTIDFAVKPRAFGAPLRGIPRAGGGLFRSPALLLRSDDDAKGALRPPCLSLDVSAFIRQLVEAPRAPRRLAEHGVGVALVPTQFVSAHHRAAFHRRVHNGAPLVAT